MGHEQTSRHVGVMSVIPLKADIHHQRGLHVRLVPIADIGERIAPVHRSAQGCHMASVDPTLLRSGGVAHLHPKIFAPPITRSLASLATTPMCMAWAPGATATWR
jgi:hypothetical protein